MTEQWYSPQSLAAALEMARQIVVSGLADRIITERKKDERGNWAAIRMPEDAAVARVLGVLAYGAELGWPPMRSLRLVQVVEGMPCLGADGIRGLVAASPVCAYLRPTEQNDAAATWVTRRITPDGTTQPEQSYRYTLDDADAAGLLRRETGPWRSHPARMLSARACKYLCQDIFADVLTGCLTDDEAREIADRDRDRGAAYLPAPTQARSLPRPGLTPAEAAAHDRAVGAHEYAALPDPDHGDARDRTGAEVAQARPTMPAGVSATQTGQQSASTPATTATQEAGTIPAGTTTPQPETAEQARRKRRTHAELLVELRESLTDAPQTSEDLARRVGIEIATAKKLIPCLPATILRTSVVGDRTVYQAQGPVPADPTPAATHTSPATPPLPATTLPSAAASTAASTATVAPPTVPTPQSAGTVGAGSLTPPPTPQSADPYKVAADVYSRALAGLHGCGPGTSMQQLRDRFAAAKGQSLADLEVAAYALLGTDLQDAWAKGLPVVAAQVGVTEREMSGRLWQRLAMGADGMGMDGLLHAQASFIESATKADPMQPERF